MCSNEGVVVNTILGTENGRIFFTSGDSHVYEIVYKRGVLLTYHQLLCLGRLLWLLLLLHQYCGWKQDHLPSLKTLQGNVLWPICYLHWSYLLRSCYWTAVYSFGSLLVASCFTCSDNSLYVYSLGKERNTFVYVNSIRSIKEACSHYFERQPEYSVLFNSTIRDHERFVCIPVIFWSSSLRWWTFMSSFRIHDWTIARLWFSHVLASAYSSPFLWIWAEFVLRMEIHSIPRLPIRSFSLMYLILFRSYGLKVRLPPNFSRYNQNNNNNAQQGSLLNEIPITKPQELNQFPYTVVGCSTVVAPWSFFFLNNAQNNSKALYCIFIFLAVIGVVMQECSSLGNWTQQVYFTPYQDDILDMRVDYQCILSFILILLISNETLLLSCL